MLFSHPATYTVAPYDTIDVRGNGHDARDLLGTPRFDWDPGQQLPWPIRLPGSLTAVGQALTVSYRFEHLRQPKNHFRMCAGNFYVVITATDTPFCDDYLQLRWPLGPQCGPNMISDKNINAKLLTSAASGDRHRSGGNGGVYLCPLYRTGFTCSRRL